VELPSETPAATDTAAPTDTATPTGGSNRAPASYSGKNKKPQGDREPVRDADGVPDGVPDG
jgi:hypothetical protein